MSYEVWVDAYKGKHIISEMTTDYIKNCINQIERACYPMTIREGKFEDEVDENIDVLSVKWCELYGNGYLKAFNEELNKRKI